MATEQVSVRLKSAQAAKQNGATAIKSADSSKTPAKEVKVTPAKKKARETKAAGAKNPGGGKRQKAGTVSEANNHGEDGATEVQVEKPAKKSRAKATIEKLLALREEMNGRRLSYRLVHARLGGSHSTIGALLSKLDMLTHGEIDIPIQLSQATQEAIEADIRRHLELYRETLVEREQAVADVKADIELIVKAFEAFYNDLAEL